MESPRLWYFEMVCIYYLTSLTSPLTISISSSYAMHVHDAGVTVATTILLPCVWPSFIVLCRAANCHSVLAFHLPPSWFLCWYYSQVTSSAVFSHSHVHAFIFILSTCHPLHPSLRQYSPLGTSPCTDQLSSFLQFTSPTYSDTSVVVVQIHGCCFHIIPGRHAGVTHARNMYAQYLFFEFS